MVEFKQLNRKQYNALSAGQKKEFKKAYIAHHLPIFKKHCEGTGLNPEMLEKTRSKRPHHKTRKKVKSKRWYVLLSMERAATI